MRALIEKHIGKSATALGVVAAALGYALGADPALVKRASL